MTPTTVDNSILAQAREVRYARTVEQANALLGRPNEDWRIVGLFEENEKCVLMLARVEITWLTTGQAAKRLGRSTPYVKARCEQHKLIHKVGDDGTTQILSSAVDKMLQEEWERGYAG